MMKRLRTTACLFAVITIAIVSSTAPVLLAQEARYTAKAGQSKQGTPDSSITARVDKIFEKWDKPNSPGCALGIVKDGQLIYKRGYGMANLDHNVSITPTTVMDIMSMDKQFTAMSILLLSKRGKLSLDDEIHKYLPELPQYQSPITIRHLIHHTSGIRDFVHLTALAGVRGNVEETEDNVLSWITRQKELNFKPGEEYLYSNSEYILLDLIVKRVSGKAMREFAEDNIFKPLGMNNTHIRTDRTLVVKNRATGYFPGINGGFSVAVTKRGAMDSTVEDLFLWDQNFYNNKLGGGPGLITEELSTGMLNNGEKIDYAFGLRVGEYRGLKNIGHGGGGGGFQSAMFRYPEQNFSVMCLCNGYIGAGVFTAQVTDIFLADQFKKGAGGVSETVAVAGAPGIISVPEKELASLTGLYVDPVTESYIHFFMEDGKLTVGRDTGYALSPLSQNRFKVVRAPGVEIAFVPPIAGGRMQVKVITSGKTTTYDAVQSETLTSGQLAEFTGKYLSDELGGATYTLSIKDGKLVLEAMGRKDILLTPAFGDVFFIVGLIHWYPEEPNRQLAIVKFTRDRQNAVTGFRLSREPEGPKDLRFERVHGSPARPLGILFDSERDNSATEDQSIYLMAPDGSNVRRLAHAEGVTSWLADWSPDRRRIVFSSNRTGPWDDLYVMDADGGNVRQLTDSPEASEHDAAWSPDGRHIAYDRAEIAADRTRLAAQIWIIDADGSNARPLTGRSRNMRPAWSPDGSTIAFMSDRHAEVDTNLIGTDDGDLEIYLMERDGSNVRRLTECAETAGGPAWSPGRTVHRLQLPRPLGNECRWTQSAAPDQ